MTNQIKYVLAPLALCLLAGCGKPEAGKPSIAERNPEAWERFCERVRSGEYAENAIEQGADPEEVAQGIRNAERSCEN